MYIHGPFDNRELGECGWRMIVVIGLENLFLRLSDTLPSFIL
jgi:hypothetical protein